MQDHENREEPVSIAEKMNLERDPLSKAADGGADESIDKYPSRWRVLLIVCALCSALFCIGLDQVILTVAIPKISNRFGSLGDIGWYGSSYMLTACGFVLSFGKIYKLFSPKWVYLCAVLIFEIGSLVSGVAPSSKALIIGRLIAGIGVAGIFSGTPVVIQNIVPLQMRAAYMGLVGSMFGVAGAAGPVLGGVFTDKLTWRWCFYINLPLGAVTVLVILLLLPAEQTASQSPLSFGKKWREIDYAGSVCFLAAVTCLLLVLQWGGTSYSWANWRLVLLLTLLALLTVVCIFIQRSRGERATVPPRIALMRDVCACAWFNFCLNASLFIILYYLPIWFQVIKETSAIKSGVMMLPLLITFIVFAALAGLATSTFGYYTPLPYLSCVSISIAAGLLSRLYPDAGRGIWMGFQTLYGIGVGMGVNVGVVAMQTVLEDDDLAIGAALQSFAIQLGGTIFLSVAQRLFTTRLLSSLRHVLPEQPSVSGLLKVSGVTELKAKLLTAFPSRQVQIIDAFNDALTRTFILSAAIGAVGVLGAIFIRHISVKEPKTSSGVTKGGSKQV